MSKRQIVLCFGPLCSGCPRKCSYSIGILGVGRVLAGPVRRLATRGRRTFKGSPMSVFRNGV